MEPIPITCKEIAPSATLAPFVRCYSFRKFCTKDQEMIKPWHASNEITMVFFFQDKPVHLTDPLSGKVIKGGSPCGLVGLGTRYNGDMLFKGTYSFFSIEFRPCGFHRIFGLSPGEMNNQILGSDDIFNNTAGDFFEQLSLAEGLSEMGLLTDTFLLNHLRKQKQKNHCDSITSVAAAIIKSHGVIDINKLAAHVNMSSRNFERNFILQVGVSPKLFACITRFNYALDLKLKNIQSNWTFIAHECEYFDQMHLIKEFKKFSGNKPSHFLQQTPLAHETYLSKIHP